MAHKEEPCALINAYHINSMCEFEQITAKSYQKMFSNLIKNLPIIRPLIEERDQLHNLVTAWKRHLRFLPPGHFYSPIPNLDEVKENESSIFGSMPKDIPAIDLVEASQLQLMDEFKTYYPEEPFTDHKTPGLRYYFENTSYS